MGLETIVGWVCGRDGAFWEQKTDTLLLGLLMWKRRVGGGGDFIEAVFLCCISIVLYAWFKYNMKQAASRLPEEARQKEMGKLSGYIRPNVVATPGGIFFLPVYKEGLCMSANQQG